MNVKKLLQMAADYSNLRKDLRTFRLGAVAIRKDDVMVYACNGNSQIPNPSAHCEARLVRKLDRGATVFLARTNALGQWACSKPCPSCQRKLRRAKVKKVYYTLGINEYGVLEL